MAKPKNQSRSDSPSRLRKLQRGFRQYESATSDEWTENSIDANGMAPVAEFETARRDSVTEVEELGTGFVKSGIAVASIDTASIVSKDAGSGAAEDAKMVDASPVAAIGVKKAETQPLALKTTLTVRTKHPLPAAAAKITAIKKKKHALVDIPATAPVDHELAARLKCKNCGISPANIYVDYHSNDVICVDCGLVFQGIRSIYY